VLGLEKRRTKEGRVIKRRFSSVKGLSEGNQVRGAEPASLHVFIYFV